MDTDWRWDPICPYLAVLIAPPHHRKGFGSEALKLGLTYLFKNTVANVVTTGMSSWNHPAVAFTEKNGFKYAGAERRASYRDGQYYEELSYDILRREWLELHGGE